MTANPRSNRIFRPLLLLGTLLWLVVVSQFQNRDKLSFFNTPFSIRTPERAASQPYTCSFRNHTRYYGLTDDDYPPAFLRSAFYIHGKPPLLLPVSSTPASTKVCFHPDHSHLRLFIQNRSTGRRESLKLKQPLMDGTNPTLVSLERLKRTLSSESFQPWQRLWGMFPRAAYLVSSTFKSANQCDYDLTRLKLAKHGSKEYEVVDHQRPPGRHHRNEVDLMLVDANFGTLWQNTILSHSSTFSADDARLLVHDGSLYVTFKRYGDHGGKGAVLYLAQLATKVTGDISSYTSVGSSLQIYAAQEWAMCCGRNFMALPENEAASGGNRASGQLSFLTWPDPIWVQTVDTHVYENQDMPQPVPVSFENPTESSRNAIGKSAKFHGTSGFLLELPNDEYLGVGHIHRERKWAKDHRVDARFGHHYTHAFFTMSSQPPYRLKRLSQEFVLPSTTNVNEADVIQFASGLEWTKDRRQIVLSYGVNDCEGAIVHVEWGTVDQLLVSVPEGSQVSHTINNISRPEFLAAIRQQQT